MGWLRFVRTALRDTIQERNSLVTLESRTGLREAVVRVATVNPRPAIAALEARGFTVRHAWRG